MTEYIWTMPYLTMNILEWNLIYTELLIGCGRKSQISVDFQRNFSQGKFCSKTFNKQGLRLTFQLASPVASDRFDSLAKTDFSLARYSDNLK